MGEDCQRKNGGLGAGSTPCVRWTFSAMCPLRLLSMALSGETRSLWLKWLRWWWDWMMRSNGLPKSNSRCPDRGTTSERHGWERNVGIGVKQLQVQERLVSRALQRHQGPSLGASWGSQPCCTSIQTSGLEAGGSLLLWFPFQRNNPSFQGSSMPSNPWLGPSVTWLWAPTCGNCG